MLILSPLWFGRLRAARRLTNLLIQTLIVHPALLFFLLFLLAASNEGSAGQMFLREAENLVRDAPAGQVWGCRSQDRRVTEFPDALLNSGSNGAAPPVNFQAAPLSTLCVKSPIGRDAWASQTDSALLLFYKLGVLLSIALRLAVRTIRGQEYGVNA